MLPHGPRLIVALSILVVACDAAPSAPEEGGGDALPAALRGQAAFVNSCAPCHASGDGADLTFFHFTDTTIVRRAVAHVDTATARDIVAFVTNLPVPRTSRNLRLFQPGDAVLQDDVAFAVSLFGADDWPGDLTPQQLLAIDPLYARAAVTLPLWSVEGANLDWMPDIALPEAILADDSDRARMALARYRANPTTDNLVRAVSALRAADRRVDNPGAPCLLDVPQRVDYQLCFQVRRWTATLAAQHMIRQGLRGRLHQVAHDTWWDVGNVARKAVGARAPFQNGERIWAMWMYLGWIFEPARFTSAYTGGGLVRIGLPRHATFVALRSEVARPSHSVAPYADVESAARFAPPHWTFDAVRFGYLHLLERIRLGEVPAATARAEAQTRVDAAYSAASAKLPQSQRDALRQVANQVLAALQ